MSRSTVLTESMVSALLPATISKGMGMAKDVNDLTPGIFYVASQTVNLPSGINNNAILENIAVSANMILQRITTRTTDGSAVILTRVIWQGSPSPWSKIQLSPL